MESNIEVNDTMEDDTIETNYETPAKKKAKEPERSSPFQRSWPD
jgi:hypothetical protein